MAEQGYAIYRVRVSTLTPLHIGSGVELLNEYDYVIHGGRTWRIHEDALLEAQDVDDPKVAARLAQTPPGQLLERRDFRPDSGFFRYVIQGTPRAKGEGAQLREQLKDVYDRPYLPGSSLKGALRTAIAWYAWGAAKLQPSVRKLGRSRKWAGQEYERMLLGQNPNHDLLRAIQVSDSRPVDPDRLVVVNAQVLTRGGNLAAPIEMEAVRPDTTFELTVKLDLALFSGWARSRGLTLKGRNWLEKLPQVVQRHSRDRIRAEARWFGDIPAAARIAQFYTQLGQARLGERQCLLSLGWGTGWEDKTFGSHLQKDPDFMAHIIDTYRLARGNRRPGDPFPKSRRVVVAVTASGATPVSPLGWCLVEMTPRE